MSDSKLLKNLLEIQNQMKLYHWQTRNYGRHKASDLFVTKAIGIIDRIIESYQGTYGTIKLKDSDSKLVLKNLGDKEIVVFLKKMKKFIQVDFTQMLNSKEDHDLLALRDEMLENIDVTLYLFEFK